MTHWNDLDYDAAPRPLSGQPVWMALAPADRIDKATIVRLGHYESGTTKGWRVANGHGLWPTGMTVVAWAAPEQPAPPVSVRRWVDPSQAASYEKDVLDP